MSDFEQQFGKAGVEADQGYTPIPNPVSAAPDPDLEQAQAIERIIDRDPPAPIVERAYQRTDGPDKGERYPEHGVVELDRAAKDLSEIRQLEKTLADADAEERLAAEIDAARGFGRGESLRAQEATQQPEHTPVTSELQQQSAPMDGVDPEIQAALSNPKILSVLSEHYSAAEAKVAAAQTQAEAQASTAIQQAAQWAQTNAELAAAAILARPELRGVHPSQIPGALQALATANPQAAQQIQQQLSHAQTLVQQAQEAQRVQQQRAAIQSRQQFQAFGAAQDEAFDKSLAAEPPETVRAIKETAMQMMRETGLSDADLAYQWNNNGLLRSAQAQGILADAARYRMLKAGIPMKAARTAPQVQRPGSSVDRPDAGERDSFALEQRYSGPLSVKDAAKLTIARRARAR